MNVHVDCPLCRIAPHPDRGRRGTRRDPGAGDVVEARKLAVEIVVAVGVNASLVGLLTVLVFKGEHVVTPADASRDWGKPPSAVKECVALEVEEQLGTTRMRSRHGKCHPPAVVANALCGIVRREEGGGGGGDNVV
jgi:hypothetical protein